MSLFFSARNLRLIRIERGLTQRQLAKRSGLQQGYISQLELGLRLRRANHVGLLARALAVPETALTNEASFAELISSRTQPATGDR